MKLVEPADSQKPRALSCDPPNMLEDVTGVLKKIAAARNRPLFALLAHSIHEETVEEIFSWKEEIRRAGKAGNLDILINSPGGSLNSCYIIARFFSRCVDSWEALVPLFAASGATLICLGSSNIVLSEIAQLGPLDPQVYSKRREKFSRFERQSPLEAFQAVRYLGRSSLEWLDFAMNFLAEERGVAPHLALETASRMAVQLCAPISGKIEPYDLGAFSLDSKVAVEYCRRIIEPSDAAKKTQRAVDPRALVEAYPAHEFVIDIEEAKHLNFAVTPPEETVEGLFGELREHLDVACRCVGLVS
jgi:serine dehydrogenase proteinase